MSYSYEIKDGIHVMTSQFLRNRGTCCKSNCLHCPYKFTIKNFPVEFEKVSQSNEGQVKSIFHEAYGQNDITSSLLGSAFGKPKHTYKQESYFLLKLKGFPCGIAEVIDNKLKSFHLLEHFRDQGIDETYLMSILVKN